MDSTSKFVVAQFMILAGIQMVAIGLLGELQVRHYTHAESRAVCCRSVGAADFAGEQSMLSDKTEENWE